MSTYFVYYTAHLPTGDKDRNILVDSDRPDIYNRTEIKVLVAVQTDGANARAEAYYVPSRKAYDDFLGEVFDA